ncbi:MAG: hypothetical protein LBK01_05205 [Burkholderiaceae bacterium]|jgi:hypothetical protein|nr:hypothetical protein [Burkholderiaceae bacterium]
MPDSRLIPSRKGLLSVLLRPGVRVVGGIFSLLVAFFFGTFSVVKRKRQKTVSSRSDVAASSILLKLQVIRQQLEDFRDWLEQHEKNPFEREDAAKQIELLRDTYYTWTSHEKMQEVLSTVQYNPHIGMNVSNGLHELRNIGLALERAMEEETLNKDGAANAALLVTVRGHLAPAIVFFSRTYATNGETAEK